MRTTDKNKRKVKRQTYITEGNDWSAKGSTKCRGEDTTSLAICVALRQRMRYEIMTDSYSKLY